MADGIGMENGDMVIVSFTGRDADSGRVFETTDVEAAKKAGFWRENAVFAPIPVVIGNNDLLKALEDELLQMKEGEKRSVKLPPEKAFGQRRKELSGVIPLQQFRSRQINPVRGMVIDVNGRYGKVQSISGGRVRVDFNSDLAGREVEYEIRIEKVLKTAQEKVDALTTKFFPIKDKKAKTKINGNELEVTLPAGLPGEIQPVKQMFMAAAIKNIKGIEKVKFVEEFVKPKEEAVKSAEAGAAKSPLKDSAKAGNATIGKESEKSGGKPSSKATIGKKAPGK